MNPVIEIEDVSFAYSNLTVIEDVTLDVDEGEFLGLVGPNGSGKTTLMEIMLGLLRPDSGRVRLFGQPASEFDDGRRLGYVKQDSSAVDRSMPITVREVVRMGRYPHVGLNELSEEDERLIDRALESAGIEDLSDRRVGKLSGGQRQRTFIARTLAAEADLLALDEPTVGVDADSRERFFDLLRSLNEKGITIVLIEHDLGVVTEYVDRVVCINRDVRYNGTPKSLFESDAVVDVFGTNIGRYVATN